MEDNNMLSTKIRHKLRLYRKENGLSSQGLARQLDISYMTLNRFLIEEKPAAAFTIEKLITFLENKGFWNES
jgi:DNA-binding XRE family transcriptional regulator